MPAPVGKITRPAVILEGGPRDGWCYYVDDIEHQARATAATGHLFAYSPTGRYTPHPVTGVDVLVWQHTGGTAASTAATAPERPTLANVCPACGSATLSAASPEGHRMDLNPLLEPSGPWRVIDGHAVHRPRADMVNPDSLGGHALHYCPTPRGDA